MAKQEGYKANYTTEEIDRMFEKVPKGAIFTGTGYGLGENKTVKKTAKKTTPKKKK